MELIPFDRIKGQQNRAHTHTFTRNRNEYVGEIKTGTELDQQHRNGRVRRKKVPIDEMMMMMRKATTKKKREKREIEKLFFFCVERDFNEFAKFVRGGNIFNVYVIMHVPYCRSA